MQAVILAGGLGSRLRGAIPEGVPKPMAPIGSRPFLAFVLDQLVDSGVTAVLLLLGHRAEVVSDHFGSSYRDVAISYSVESEPLGTGGAVVSAWDSLADEFLLLNGDTYLGIDYADLMGRLDACGLAMGLVEVDDVGRFGAVQVDHGRVCRLEEKGGSGAGLINGGVYAVSRNLLSPMPRGTAFSFENAVLQQRVAQIRPAYLAATGPFFDIGVPSDYEAASRHLLRR